MTKISKDDKIIEINKFFVKLKNLNIMGTKKLNMEKHGLILNRLTFNLDYAEDFIAEMAKKQGLILKSFFNIKYFYPPSDNNHITLGLTEFISRETGITWDDNILERANWQCCNTGSKLASILLENQDQIPETWEKYKLFFPGTVFISQSGRRFIVMLFKGKKDWEFKFRLIEGFPVLKQARFVFDCRKISFPSKITLNSFKRKISLNVIETR
ncbi:MAG: hypothetical protein WC264_00700 [Candidatus Paceibacterota bacterium]